MHEHVNEHDLVHDHKHVNEQRPPAWRPVPPLTPDPCVEHNRTHVLLLLAAVATYTIVATGLLALGAHVSRNTQRVLHAIEIREQA